MIHSPKYLIPLSEAAVRLGKERGKPLSYRRMNQLIAEGQLVKYRYLCPPNRRIHFGVTPQGVARLIRKRAAR